MFMKKVLNQPNLVGTMMIALLLGAGFVYAFAFDGFNMETVSGTEVDTWLAQAGGVSYGGPCNCKRDRCPKMNCIGCGIYDCGESYCGPCGCADICTNAVGKACRRKNDICEKNPPKDP